MLSAACEIQMLNSIDGRYKNLSSILNDKRSPGSYQIGKRFVTMTGTSAVRDMATLTRGDG